MVAGKPTIQYLKRQIESRMVRAESGRHFLPRSYLDLIFTIKDIEGAIDELKCPIDEKFGLAQEIHDQGCWIFAALIKNGEEDLITRFRKHEMLVSESPLAEDQAKRIMGEFGVAFAREHQWQFLPYMFRRNMRDCSRDISYDEMILPFIGDSEAIASGGFGDISSVEIFPSQQDFVLDKSGSARVVRKKIRARKSQSEEAYHRAFLNEQFCLRMLDRLEHPNIIPLLASYTYRGEHFFLFPAFDMDLSTFFKREHRFGDFAHDHTFFAALRGLSSALSRTHRLHLVKDRDGFDFEAIGYHHDLRPANILVSKNNFILADFGLGKLKPNELSSQTQWKVGNGDYLAPECMDSGFKHQSVGRAIDVWAFGCLILEVATFISKGSLGLGEFRSSRMSPSPHDRWEDTCFYAQDSELKPAVHRWLATLLGNILPATPMASLLLLSKKALRRDPNERPKIEVICAELSRISLGAHLVAVLGAFQDRVGDFFTTWPRQSSRDVTFWIQIKRLETFGYILGLIDADIMPQVSFHEDDCYNRILKVFKTLLRKVESEKVPPDVKALQRDKAAEKIVRIDDYVQDEVCELVDCLWDLLTPNVRARIDTNWLQAMFDTDDVDRLDVLERSFKTGNDPIREKGAAMAMMRKIRLEMESGPTTLPKGFIVTQHHIQDERILGGHSLGLFRRNLWVLVERMSWSSNLEAVSVDQRTIVMALKAQGLSKISRPAGQLRTLDCIGVFEDLDECTGFGFIYRIPASGTDEDPPSITTLNQLLAQPYETDMQSRRPLLGDKFQLASTLAQFLVDFHNLGWLHENFHSRNIVFFNAMSSQTRGRIISTQVLKQPYVVGLHKSRLGGELWDTEGPVTGSAFQDYQHPAYLRTGRYRAAYDYYSLGLVLLEIGYWCSLRVWSESPKCLRMNLFELRQELVERYVPRLGVNMGVVYRDVVHFCLTATADSDVDLDVNTEETFARKISEPLEELARIVV